MCILLAFTFWASWRVDAVTVLKNRWHFNNGVLEVENGITDELSNFIGLLRGGAALVAAAPDMDSAKFETFANRLQLKKWYPGVQGVGFAQKVESTGVNSLEQKLRAEGVTNFAIHPSADRPVMFPIVFIQPLNLRNQYAIGYDMFSEPVRHAAMLEAATNGPAVSGKVTLVQEIYASKQPGFVLYVPVFRGGPFPNGIKDREAALSGFMYSPFRAGDFFSAIFHAERGSRLHFTIYDGTNVDQSALLYESTNAASAHPWLTTSRVLQIPGHQWTINFETTPAFEHILGGKTTYVVPAAGASVSLILFAFTFYFVRQHEELLRRGAERDKAQQEIESLNRDLECRVQERTAELQETNEQLEAFIYSVAHDLRTPLRSIRGFAEILQEDCGPKLDDSARNCIGRVIRAAGGMDDLILDLLNYSQVSRAKVEVTPVDLDKMLSELRNEFDDEIQQTHATLSIQPHLPMVLAHESTLRQAIINLLSNSLKFVRPGERPDVWVRSEPVADGFVRLWVEDKGLGIKSEHHERIFGVFEQLEPQNYPGTGIGLAIVRRAVERMGGRAGVESEFGKGSRFYIELRKA